MTLEALVRHERFVSELLTTTVGRLNLVRPAAVRRANGRVSVDATATALQQAHLKAVHEGVATMVTSLAVPFAGMEDVAGATPVKPDFAIVTPRHRLGADRTEASDDGRPFGSWLVMGDAKDYERVRSRIDDQRMLKGFLQVALGAASARAWSKVPVGMTVHSWGALAVPRNAYLQPEAIVECLDDHRSEVMDRVRERQAVLESRGDAAVSDDELPGWVGHLAAAYDPASCPSCAMFAHCRSEVRSSEEPVARLVELGIPVQQRPGLIGLVDGTGTVAASAPASNVALVNATLSGMPQSTGRRRTDPVGTSGTVNVVIAKSDAAALGVHGIALRNGDDSVPTGWSFTVFDDPQAPTTRLAVMELIGRSLDAALGAASADDDSQRHPIHLVMPDSVTGDVLVSIADSLAGVEISRLRWQRDLDMGRPPLTFNGEPAAIPDALTATQRLAVSFLLEADRSRAMALRSALVDIRSVLAAHVVPGGPQPDALRLDYLVRWASTTEPLDHRTVSDEIAESDSTPGARLSNRRSDAIHAVSRRGRVEGQGYDPVAYGVLVRQELEYKTEVLDGAANVLSSFDVSRLREVHRALEGDAQAVWPLHASDLVRFGRVPWWWRNDQVDQLDTDSRLEAQLTALGNPQAARELATTAGNREVALATVTQVAPNRLRIASRRIKEGSEIHVAQTPAGPIVDWPSTTLKVQGGSFKFGEQWVGTLVADEQTATDGTLLWNPSMPVVFPAGTEVVVIDCGWFTTCRSRREVAVKRPSLDQTSSPKAGCVEGDFTTDPKSHQWCCRPHEEAEAEFADELASRRDRGELNPQAWPPVIDEDQFDTLADGTPTEADPQGVTPERPPGLTMDDLE